MSSSSSSSVFGWRLLFYYAFASPPWHLSLAANRKIASKSKSTRTASILSVEAQDWTVHDPPPYLNIIVV